MRLMRGNALIERKHTALHRQLQQVLSDTVYDSKNTQVIQPGIDKQDRPTGLPMPNPQSESFSRHAAFTLAELLIALAILGVIATFTIPKVLQTQQDQRYKSIAKETAAMLEGSLQQLQLKGTLTGNTYSADLTPYMNYVTVQTTGQVDSQQNSAVARDCSGGWTCLKLHNGAVLHFWPNKYFGGTDSLRALQFGLDPDGIVAGNSQGRSVMFFLYYDGKVRTYKTMEANTQDDGFDRFRNGTTNHLVAQNAQPFDLQFQNVTGVKVLVQLQPAAEAHSTGA
jgi:prepilin-type N-terminal cleavage/methylation domain-containing protein